MPKVAVDIADRLRDLRKRLGLTQEAFGELAGVGYSQVSVWEAGKQVPARGRLIRLAKRLGASAAIFEEGGPMPSEVVNRPLSGETGVKPTAHAVAEGSDLGYSARPLVRQPAAPVPSQPTDENVSAPKGQVWMLAAAEALKRAQEAGLTDPYVLVDILIELADAAAEMQDNQEADGLRRAADELYKVIRKRRGDPPEKPGSGS